MFSPPPTFTPIVEDLRLAHTHTYFARLPGVGAARTAHLQNFYQKSHPNHFSAHGSTFFSGAFSGSRGVARCRKWWCFAPGRVGSRTLPCKVVKVVFLEVFFLCVSSPCAFHRSFRRHQTRGHTYTAIMARRTAGKPPCWTPSERGAFRDKLRGSRGGLLALSWAFVLVFSVLSCGYCDAESEFSILEEAQVLAEQMKKLSSQELGVFTMQVRVFCCCV